MEDPKEHYGPTWTSAQCEGVGKIERRYRKRRELASAQGLRPNEDDLLKQELQEVGQVLTGSQLRDYKIARGKG